MYIRIFIVTHKQAKGGGGQAAYHPTCAAMLGLAPHEHHGFGPAMPSVLPTLRRQAGLEDEKDEL